MAYPTLPEFQGIPAQYQPGAHFVSDSAYQGGGYYSNEAGAQYDYAQLEKLWIDAGGNPAVAPQMAYISKYDESGGYVGAWNSSGATGLWQVEWPMNYGGTRQDLFTPLVNAQQAVKLYNASGFSPWRGDKIGSENIPPATSVPGENSPVPGGNPAGSPTLGQGAGGSGSAASAAPQPSTLSQFLGVGNLADSLERLGLILLGGGLILLGIYMLAGRQVLKMSPMGAVKGGKLCRSPGRDERSREAWKRSTVRRRVTPYSMHLRTPGRSRESGRGGSERLGRHHCWG